MNRLVIIAEDVHCAEAIRRELRHGSNCDVIGYAVNRRPVVAALRSAAPDIVLLDDAVGADCALASLREARAAAPGAKIVVLAGVMTPARLEAVTQAGADAAIARSVNPSALGTLVREIAEGRVFHAFSRTAAAPLPAADTAGLTPRELEILRLAAGGASNARIARTLWVTEQTVKFHLSNTYRKLGVENRTQASHFAFTRGLFTAPECADDLGDMPAAMAA
jgi:DNA-binding NarL/FixJ family response regulator